MAGLTRDLAAFIAALAPEHLPAQAIATARRGIADCVGVMFAGRDEPVVRIARASIGAAGDAGPDASAGASADAAAARVPLLGDRGRADALDAAFVNATAAHALDYDDTGLDGHPSVVLAPVVLAQGLACGADGPRTIAAYVAGYEAWAELVGRDADKYHGKGWHPTSVLGTVAAAAAGASLARLDAARTAHALGLAASMAAGVIANFGSMTKPLQVGFAARNGLTAVRLAAMGATSAPDALEHPRGLLAALSPAGRVRLDGPLRAADPWQIVAQGLNIKRYPVCYGAHRAIDAALSIRAALLPEPAAAIASIDVEIGRLQAAMLRSARPATVLDAKFSAEFAVSAALVHGGVGLAQVTEPVLADPAVRALIERVQVRPIVEQDADEPIFAPADRVVVHLRDGRHIASAPVRHALGHAQRPIDDDALRAKFLDCATPTLGADLAERWWHALQVLDTRGPAGLPCVG
jgi:2-methylcitrate dehydratase PrpD